jgi:hypothetical protein
MSANPRRMSRALDQHRFDRLADSVASESSDVGLVLLDCDLRIRGVNATYEAISMRRRDDLLGERVPDVFPDAPGDPQAANGISHLQESVETAIRGRRTDSMPIVRYDITDPRNPDVFLPKLWTCSNTAVELGGDEVGVLHRVGEITSLDEALTALDSDMALDPAGQVHVLSALIASVRKVRDDTRALAQEIEQLHRALKTRDIIGQAKGTLMERFNLDAAAAFQLLVRLSQQSNTPLAVVAQKLVEIDHPSA